MEKRFWATVFRAGLFMYASFCPPVFAYLDPGSGSYFYQILLSLMLAVPFFIGHVFAKISEWIRMIFKKKTGPGEKT